MSEASEIRVGQVYRIDNKLWKVVLQEVRGKGKAGKTVHVKIKDLEDGHTAERSFRYEDRLEDVDTHRLKMQYLYRDGESLVFMNPEDYTQPTIPAKTIGKQAILLKENMELDVLMEGDRILSIEFPALVELKVVSAPEPIKGSQSDKEIELENGIKILAPQFVKTGDSVRVSTQDFSYAERVTLKSMASNAVPMKKEDGEK